MVTSRIRFTTTQKAELWERWRTGSSAAAISRALDRRNKTGVFRIVALHGGIAPVPRRRALAALRLEEREEISRGIALGKSLRRIARRLGRAPSTVSREIRRNGGSRGYRANQADRSAWQRALRPKPCRLALHGELRWRVAQKLALQWSPEQISGWLKREFPADQERQISPEAIYRSLFVQTRGVLKKELTAHLRTRRQMRLPKSHNAGSGQAPLMARLDRLGAAKEVAQIGSAIGRQFSYLLLESIVRFHKSDLVDALGRLVQAGLLLQHGTPPGATYLFKHALVQDAAYGSLLRESRRSLHERIAHVLLQNADLAESQPELLAHHFTEAGALEQAGQLWAKAGQLSLSRSAFVEAQSQISRALSCIDKLPIDKKLRRERINLQISLIGALNQ